MDWGEFEMSRGCQVPDTDWSLPVCAGGVLPWWGGRNLSGRYWKQG